MDQLKSGDQDASLKRTVVLKLDRLSSGFDRGHCPRCVGNRNRKIFLARKQIIYKMPASHHRLGLHVLGVFKIKRYIKD